MNYKLVLGYLIKDRLMAIRLAAFFAFLIPFVMAPQIWFSNRPFPLISYFDNLPEPNLIGDCILISVFFLCFLMFVFKPTWRYGLPVVLIYSFWALIDQNRIQPFYFEIIFIVLALTHFSYDAKRAKQCVLLIFIGTYFWSGIHKCNDRFFEIWANGLAKRIPFIPSFFRQLFNYAVPFLEAAFGLSLIFTYTRKWGIWLIACMHSMILITFIVGNFGYLVFPLTLFNVFTLFYLFYNEPLSGTKVFNLSHPKSIFIFLISIVFPLLNFFGYYDHILSFSYFSAKPKYCRLYLTEGNDLSKLPNPISQNIRMMEGHHYIDFNEWAARTIKVMVYPEERVYKKLQEHINNHLQSTNTYLEYY